jgi:hypothetical protein
MTKAFDLPHKRGAFAVAGDLQIDVALGANPQPLLLIESTRLIRATFVHTKIDYRQAAQAAVRVINDAATLINYPPGSLEILLGLQLTTGPVLWSITRRSTLGKGDPSEEVTNNPHVLGIGEYARYHRLATTPFDKLNPTERLHVKKLAPPPLPPNEFATRAEAERWVRGVIDWCKAHYSTCGGPIEMAAAGP